MEIDPEVLRIERRDNENEFSRLHAEKDEMQDKYEKELTALRAERDGIKHHMDACRALLKVPDNEVLHVAIVALMAERDRLRGALKVALPYVQFVYGRTQAEQSLKDWKVVQAALSAPVKEDGK